LAVLLLLLLLSLLLSLLLLLLLLHRDRRRLIRYLIAICLPPLCAVRIDPCAEVTLLTLHFLLPLLRFLLPLLRFLLQHVVDHSAVRLNCTVLPIRIIGVVRGRVAVLLYWSHGIVRRLVMLWLPLLVLRIRVVMGLRLHLVAELNLVLTRVV
jgi:hypothetical protein